MDLEEELKWFEQDSESQSDGFIGLQPSPAGSAPYATGDKQRASHGQQLEGARLDQALIDRSGIPHGYSTSTSPAMHHRDLYRQGQVPFPSSSQDRYATAYRGALVPRRPQTPQYTARQKYFGALDEATGKMHYYIQTPDGFEEVDPSAHGLTQQHDTAYSSPAARVVPRPDFASSSSLARPMRPHGAQRSPQSYPSMDEEAMFDQMAMDWDPSPQRSGFTPHRNSQTHAPPASLTARDDTHMTAMRRALQAARYRADMAESMLSRVRSDSVENSAFSSPRASAAFSDPARLPSTGFQGQQQQRVFANAPTPSFEFDPDFRRKQPGAALTETASASRSGEQPAGSSSWGLPNNDPMLTLRKSAYVPPITSQQKIKIVHKSAIPDIFASIFPFHTFNQVQSACFATITKSDENIVVTAPTGAGKTVLFELAMIRLWQNEKEGQIVYIAPTKSLCSERFKDWNVKFSNLRQKCVELTGDTDEGALREAKTARLIVTTPEKWDSVTRNLRGGTPWYEGVKVFCIDEVHLLAEERGATLEVIVSRMRSANPEIRFVAVSATVPNIEDVAVWLGPGKASPDRPVSKDADGKPLPPMARVMKFGDEFRPVPLQKHVHGYPCGNKSDQQFDASLNYKLLELIDRYAGRKPVLIFCNTRKGCATAAKQLLKDYNAHCEKRSAVPPWPRPIRKANGKPFVDSSLHELTAAGIGIHHAGLNFQDRRNIEERFLSTSGGLHVLCTTSTLAVGINLPARMVIIKGTKIWDASQSKAVDYSDLDILQMMGRAGRPQFDNHGVAVIMCKQDEKAKYEAMVKSQTILESCLHKTLVEHINSEIATRTIKCLQDAYRWLKGTFLYVRIKANPEHYRAIVPNMFEAEEDDAPLDLTEHALNPVNPEKRLEEMVAEAIKQLMEEGLAEEIGDNEIESTDYGDMLCQYSIRLTTFILLKNMKPGASAQTLLSEMCKAVEFKDMKFRSGEISEYKSWNQKEEMQWPVKKVSTTSDKVNILLQLQLGGLSPYELKISGCNTTGEAMQVLQHMKRIVSCVVDLATHKKDAVTSKAALELARCIRNHCWENTCMVLTQIPGIASKRARDIADQTRMESLQELRKAKTQVLEDICQQKPPFGKKILDFVKQLPNFDVTLEIVRETVKPNGVQVSCQVILLLKNSEVVTTNKNKGPRKLTASILLMTSDSQWIEYKRVKIATIQQEQSNEGVKIKKTVILTKPSQKIECYVSCDEYAGLNTKAVIEPTTPASKYPIPDFNDDNDDNKEGAEGSNPATEDVDEDGEAIVKTKALIKPSSRSKKSTPTEDNNDDDRLPNGNYKCRHTCEGACRHTCCVSGVAHKPKENVKKRSKFKQTNYNSDSDAEDRQPVSKKATKKAGRRSAQEIANSMSGASDLTSTGIKLDRLPKTLPATSSFKDSFPGWIGRGRLSDSDDDTLPEIQDTLSKFKHDGNADAKRSRDPLPDIDTEVSESKRAKTGNGINEQRQASGADSSAPSLQDLTGLRRESLSPKHYEPRVVDPLPSDPSSPSTIAQTRNEVRQFQRKALFRSPSFDENSEIVTKPEKAETDTEKAETDTEKTETSEVDELEDTTEWMKENVEITDD